MEKQQSELTKETVLELAEREPRFRAERLVEEIAPLLHEYFLGSYQAQGNVIDLVFPNGQHFKLTIGEVA